MKCLLITSHFPPIIGGSAKVYGNLYKYGQNTISVLTARFNYANRKIIPRNEIDSKNIHLIKYLMSPPVLCRNILHTLYVLIRYDLPIQISTLITTLALVKQQKIDVICIGELHSLGWLGVLPKVFSSAKIILYIHGEELTTKTSSRFLGKYAKFYLNKADGIVCVSQYTKNTAINMFGTAEEKIRLISNGIDLEEYHPTSSRFSIIEQYKQSNSLLIFSVGRLIERKGFDKSIEAMKLIQEKFPNIHYVIAGKGEQQNDLNNLIKKLELDAKVTMIGQLSHEELVAFYQGCDLFLMPNRTLENGDTEGFGLVFLEANAFKKPVVGGDAGGAVDAILHGKTGVLVDGNSASSIADAVIKLLENEELRKEMGEHAYQWVLQNSAEKKAEEFLDFCETIVSGQG